MQRCKGFLLPEVSRRPAFWKEVGDAGNGLAKVQRSTSSEQEVTAHLWFVYYRKEPPMNINAALLLLLILDKEMPELAADQRFHSVGLFIRIAKG